MTPEQKFERDSEQVRRASAEQQALKEALRRVLALLLDMGPFASTLQQQRLEEALLIAEKALGLA